MRLYDVCLVLLQSYMQRQILRELFNDIMLPIPGSRNVSSNGFDLNSTNIFVLKLTLLFLGFLKSLQIHLKCKFYALKSIDELTELKLKKDL